MSNACHGGRALSHSIERCLQTFPDSLDPDQTPHFLRLDP